VIDCSPKGHQPDVSTRIFQAVQQPVCIVLASRPTTSSDQPAKVWFRSLAKGKREDKFDELEQDNSRKRQLGRSSKRSGGLLSCHNRKGLGLTFLLSTISSSTTVQA
jgi:hypothetical protein